MKQTITKIYCDDCGKEILPKSDFNYLVFPYLCRFIDEKHLCFNCIKERIEHSLYQIQLGRKCENCNGHGNKKEFYGYNNDYTLIECDECSGKGYYGL